jgi:hypothetical protein
MATTPSTARNPIAARELREALIFTFALAHREERTGLPRIPAERSPHPGAPARRIRAQLRPLAHYRAGGRW